MQQKLMQWGGVRQQVQVLMQLVVVMLMLMLAEGVRLLGS